MLIFLLFSLGLKVLTFVAMDSQYGVSLTVNGRASFTVAIGPNIALDLQISPSRGAVLVNNYLVEAQQRARVQTLNAVKNGLNKFALMGQAARLSALSPITSNAINSIHTLDEVYRTLKRANIAKCKFFAC